MKRLKSPPAYPPAISDRSKGQKNNVDLKKIDAKTGNFAGKNEVFCKLG